MKLRQMESWWKVPGGHLGFDEEGICAYSNSYYDKEILEIIDIVREYEIKYQKKIPVIFGGGVFDKEDIKHYLSLGCSGVQMGTRFVVTKECDVDQKFKTAYLQASQEDIVLRKSPVGMLSRALNNSLLKNTMNQKVAINHCYGCLKECEPQKIPYCITQALVNAAKGEIEEGLVFCGSNVHRLTEMTGVKELFQELFGDEELETVDS